MFCSNCGNPVQEGQAVCLSCGFSLSPAKANNGTGWFDAPSNNGSRRGIVAIVAWFFGILGVHRLMMGNGKTGGLQLLLTLSSIVLVFPILISAVWALIDFIRIIIADEEEFKMLFVS